MIPFNSRQSRAAPTPWSVVLLGSCLLATAPTALACSDGMHGADTTARPQAQAQAGGHSDGERVAGVSASATASATASASSSAKSTADSSDCEAQSSASAEAHGDDGDQYVHDSDHQVSRDGNCEARAESSAHSGSKRPFASGDGETDQ